MRPTRRISKTCLGVAAAALVAIGAPAGAFAMPSVEPAQTGSDQSGAVSAARAQERYYESYGDRGASQQDLRSPDTRDGVRPTTLASQPAPARVIHVDGGFDWLDAAIGAAGVLGLACLTLGGAFALSRRRGPRAAGA